MNFVDTSRRLESAIKQQPPGILWDGKACIMEMKEGGSAQWRQMEWIGFYFQFICEKILGDVMKIPGPKYGKTEFDGFFEIPWDFKAHAMNTSSHRIIANDSEATNLAIREFGTVGLMLALGEVEYNDDNRAFQKWHSREKGGVSSYEKKRKERGAWSRKRKVSFALRQIMFIPITNDTLTACGSFQEGFRNSTGTPRRSKVVLNLEELDGEKTHFVDFCDSN